MLEKNRIIDELIELINNEKKNIESKNELGLFDDNKHWENIVRRLLNDAYGYELKNLNAEIKNYPGIDLGDEENGIGVQVSTTKTSAKIVNSLDKVLKHDVYEKYPHFIMFVLGDKQDSYTIDMKNYQQNIKFDWKEDIYDFNSLLLRFNEMDTEELITVLKYLKSEFGKNGIKEENYEARKSAMSLVAYIQYAWDWIKSASENGGFYSDANKYEDYQSECKKVSSMLDTTEYSELVGLMTEINGIIDIMQDGKKYMEKNYKQGRFVKDINTMNYSASIKAKAYRALNKKQIYNILKELCDNYSRNQVDIVIDMDNFQNRMQLMDIDSDIILNQFSVGRFKQIIEQLVVKSCRRVTVLYNNETELIRNIANNESVYLFDIEEDKAKSFAKYIKQSKEQITGVILVSSDIIFEKEIKELNDEKFAVAGVTFRDDLYWKLKARFSKVIELSSYVSKMFQYDEERQYDIKTLTIEQFRSMIANASDEIDHQLRVFYGGYVYISKKIASEDITGLKFMWETYDATNGYTGVIAASDEDYIAEMYNELKWEWDNGSMGYIDMYLAPQGIYK